MLFFHRKTMCCCFGRSRVHFHLAWQSCWTETSIMKYPPRQRLLAGQLALHVQYIVCIKRILRFAVNQAMYSRCSSVDLGFPGGWQQHRKESYKAHNHDCSAKHHLALFTFSCQHTCHDSSSRYDSSHLGFVRHSAYHLRAWLGSITAVQCHHFLGLVQHSSCRPHQQHVSLTTIKHKLAELCKSRQ